MPLHKTGKGDTGIFSFLQPGKQHSVNSQVRNACHDHGKGRKEAISDGVKCLLRFP